MTEATTKTCGRCHGRNPVGCPQCNSTGTVTTGVVLGTKHPPIPNHYDRDATIAALRIERDDLLARVERQDVEIERLQAESLTEHRQNTELIEANERLSSELDYLRKMAKAYQETAEARGIERDAANARAEAYLAVIDKQAAMISAIQQHEITALEMCVAFAQANLPSPVRLPKEAKCEKSDERS